MSFDYDKELNLFERTTNFTAAEFKKIPRNSDGDIHEDEFGMICCFLTDDQIDQLSGDDFTRYDNWEEEMRCLRAEFA